MSRQLFIASFQREEDLLDALAEIRDLGYELDDVYTPYPVHGLPEAMGLRPSRLPWACFLCAAAGGLMSLLGQYYLSAEQWPINVGGKPWYSFPAFIPITFELTVLFGGLGTLGAFLLRHKLLPGRKPQALEYGATDDRFVVVVPESDATFDPVQLKIIAHRYHAVAIEQRVQDGAVAPSQRVRKKGAA